MTTLSSQRVGRFCRQFSNTCISAGAIAAMGCAAHAGVIDSTINGGFFPLTVNSSAFATPSPGNYNVPGISPNTLSFDETYSFNFGGAAQFTYVAGPSTEYSVTIVVKNNTGLTWTGYELYCGAGTPDVPDYFSGLIFDYDLAPAASGPGTGGATWSALNDNWLTYSNLNVPAGATIQLNFNYAIVIAGNATGGPYIFQKPITVPTPGCLAMLGLGGLFTARRRR